MRILVIGATGPVGISICYEALSSILDSTLVLYVRSPQKIPEDISSNIRVTVVTGQLDDLDSLSNAMEGVNAVVSALGPSVKKGPLHPSGEPLAHAYEGVIATMKKHGVNRLLALGTASIPAPEDKSDIRFSALVTGVATLARNAYKDMVAIGKTISSAPLLWTIVRVPLLDDKPKRDVRAGFIGDGKTHTALSRVGFAIFVVNELKEVKEDPSPWIGKAPMLCSL